MALKSGFCAVICGTGVKERQGIKREGEKKQCFYFLPSKSQCVLSGYNLVLLVETERKNIGLEKKKKNWKASACEKVFTLCNAQYWVLEVAYYFGKLVPNSRTGLL